MLHSIHFVLAAIFTATGRPKEALQQALLACAASDHILGELTSLASEELRLSYGSLARFEIAMIVSLVAEQTPYDKESIERSLEVVTRRKGLVGEAMAVLRDSVLGGRYPRLKPLMRELTELRNSLAVHSFATMRDFAGYPPTELRVKAAPARRIEASLAAEIPELQLQQSMNRVTTRGVAQNLPEGSILVEFVRGPLIDPKGLLNGSRAGISLLGIRLAGILRLASLSWSSLGQHEESIDWSKGPADTSCCVPRHSLSAACLRLREIVFDLSSITFPPAAILSWRRKVLSCEFLSRSRRMVTAAIIDRFTFSYVGSCRDLLRLSERQKVTAGVPVVAADPDLTFLPKALESILKVPSAVFLGPSVKVSLWLGCSKLRPGWVPRRRNRGCKMPLRHAFFTIATHGFFDDSTECDFHPDVSYLRGEADKGQSSAEASAMLKSGLALAGANIDLVGKEAAGRLRQRPTDGRRVLGMDLLGTGAGGPLACETGLGQIHNTEGVLGLRWAFLLAGARSIVVSL